ncbi:MAG TPA: DEAD/DEAH box helicase [Tepidisphaeraceae bacterium]|nr:DEAD/DEAH box helicase [Tepidisphaeraceae bacterium]
MKFSDLRLIEPLLRSISTEGYDQATPIQAQSIPHILEGKDLLGCAQTGTGKTAAFALPILQRLAAATPQRRNVRALVLCPTRELALQIHDSFRTYGRNLQLRTASIFGGVNQRPQVMALRNGVDILVATPGRLLDLMNQRFCDLRNLEILVLDEADRMLDMGFIPDIRRIVAQVPAKRQTLLFSATMPHEIRQLANSLLHNPVSVQVASTTTPVETIRQSVYFVDRGNKAALLAHLYNSLPMARTIVFTRTKHGADRVVRHLHTRNIRAEAIHGNKSQNARERALRNFRSSKTPILVATDIASRGIDVDGITHVVNYDLTHEPETYVHRIGRTARAGATGAAVSFCDRDERGNLKAIERMIGQSIAVQTDLPQFTQADHPKPSQHQPRQHSHDRQRHDSQNRPHGPQNQPHGQHRSRPAEPVAHSRSAPAANPSFAPKAHWPLAKKTHRKGPARQRTF